MEKKSTNVEGESGIYALYNYNYVTDKKKVSKTIN